MEKFHGIQRARATDEDEFANSKDDFLNIKNSAAWALVCGCKVDITEMVNNLKDYFEGQYE